MKSKDAQAWGFDLIVAMMIFLAGMILFFLYILNFPAERDDVFNTLNYEGKIIGDSLLSEGYPLDWNENNVITAGILSNEKVNETKLKRFYDLANSDYNKTRRLFNMLNNYYLTFEEPVIAEGTTINSIGFQGNPKNLVKSTRVIIINNKIKNLNIYVWN